MSERLPHISLGLWSFLRVSLVPIVVFGLGLRRRGVEHIPRRGPVLFVCNHISTNDPPLVGVALRERRCYYMAKSELFGFPIFGSFIRASGAFPVVRGGADRSAIRTARGLLARGEALLMFPEGHRHVDGHLRPPLPGAGSLGLEPGVTVIPVAIWGSQRKRFGARVAIGPPVRTGDLTGARSERAAAAAERMMDAIGELLVGLGGPRERMPR